MSVRLATMDLLRERGMTTLFGNPGSTELGLLRDFPADFRYALALHEGVAVAMADGYAQATGRPAFVNLHSACGVGNAMGAVVNAFHNRAPLVITAGNQDRRHLALEPYLFARSTALMESYVKFSHEPARAQDVPAAIDRAWALARTPPQGPTFVSIPSGDWDASVNDETAGASPERDVLFGVGADGDLLDRLAERIEAAGAPALIVGGGVDQACAWDAVAELADRLSGPVWTAPQAPRLGFAEDHPLYQGHLAPGRVTAAAQLAGCDLALVLGAPVFAFLPFETAPARADGVRLPQIIHVTDDPGEAARAPALSVVAEVGSVARGLSERLRPRSPARPVAPRPAPAPVDAPAGGPIPPAFLMAALARALPGDAVLVEESPSNRNDLRAQVWIHRPASFFATASGGLGFAMPAAVGIKLASPERPVVCLVGDGSALYVPQTLWSAVRLGAAVTFVIVNNGRYAILEAAARFGAIEGLPSMELPGLDFLSLAASFGVHAVRVSEPAALPGALAAAVRSTVPVLIDVLVDPAPIPLLATEAP
ncbi:MAG TPA: benzoylformate decarboxylase [Solirubrobacteraceae bacterium]|nr:benzoylformate decarboxylase [Solirubrobacteraceae bacterium]